MKFKEKAGRSEFVKIGLYGEGKEIGRVFLYLIKNDLHKKPYGLVEDLFVEKEYRSQGLGTRLVKEAIKLAKKKKCYKLIATSRTGNSGLHKWYQKLGFKKHGVEFRINYVKLPARKCSLKQ
ncbi:MAG: GNAT family N-acetyltransferase [Patescibacteria group bacterium]|nr:GNAT family N-acetyltransferase [Patescibacteria group bacterium]